MELFELHKHLIEDYAAYTRSFIKISDQRIRQTVDEEIRNGLLWPDPLLQINPNFESGLTIPELVTRGTLHPDCDRIFRIKANPNDFGQPMTLYKHQAEAIEIASQGEQYVLTTGTGSGKSLSYIVPIVDHVLRNGSGRGIQAIIVYPMNALANSQQEELAKFLDWGLGGESLVTYERYTGQEGDEVRQRILENPPDILLTNYVMLELILTRVHEQRLIRAASDARFLVFDELHTYRGRQGADVAMLIRRCREAFSGERLLCVGTSATMASGDDLDTRKTKAVVADVATRMFGKPVAPDHVIGETLKKMTPDIDFTNADALKSLKTAITNPCDTSSFEALSNDPLSAWLEASAAITKEEQTGALIRQDPQTIGGEGGLADQLSSTIEVSKQQATEAIQDRLRSGFECKHPETGAGLFAFRLHQFITRGDTVWASIESEDTRTFSLNSGERFKRDDESTRLYPLCFCSACGQEYYRVDADSSDRTSPLLPRDRFEPTVADDLDSGYLYVSNDTPWPQDDAAILDRVPDDWLEDHNGGKRVRSNRRKSLPDVIRIRPDGTIGPDGIEVAWVPTPFRFCLNPQCKASYNFRQRSDRDKLDTLGVDGRSTATSILSLAVLMDLATGSDLDPEAKKLLSFTDNRQDAALQAGHFNDFVEVAMVRSGLYNAMASAGPGGCTHAELAQRVFNTLDLPLELYADGELRGPARKNAESALRVVLEYYLYRDLQRGWRKTSPNLEQCGLLHIEYDGVDELAGDDQYWSDKQVHSSLLTASAETRKHLITALLDHLRRNLSIKIDCLTSIGHERIVNESKQRLKDLWRIEDVKELTHGAISWPGSRPSEGKTYPDDLYVSAQSNFGQFVKQLLYVDTLQDRQLIIDQLFECLKPWGLLEEVRSANDRTGYQVPAHALKWIAGDGSRPMVDPLRKSHSEEAELSANTYFIDFYKRFYAFSALFQAKEHTAQVPAALREEREDEFRHGKLAIMFCSPTMELGIDISQLNVVNMRNVPPTPANYAQRSGRAGRPGRKSQPALVFTYCSGFSPHDRYYFKRQSKMVSGQVTAPRIELSNQDLVLAHVHAIWLSEAGLNLGKTLTDILRVNESDTELPLKDEIERKLGDASIQLRALQRARSVIESTNEITQSSWWRTDWLDDVVRKIPIGFNESCNRWRSLYRAAVHQRHVQNRVIGDHSRSEVDRNTAKRLRAQAEAQITLLTDAKSAVQGDFSSYRYFASEGFLPGYNFPRLPISAFIPARRGAQGQDEYLSRARFLAVSEFGPKAIIYHEGSRYEIHKVNLAFDEDNEGITQSSIKICGNCGYGHMATSDIEHNVCEQCGTAFEADDRISALVRMHNVTARRRKRITSDEEERLRIGFDIRSTYHFEQTDGRKDYFVAEVKEGESEIARVLYGDTARIYRINVGWNKRKKDTPPGFILDIERGYWAKNQDLPDNDDDTPDAGNNVARVIPFVEDRRNALVINFTTPGTEAEMASLQAALKEAIQQEYQLESSELAADALPSRQNRKSLFFFESAEGGAGVLRHLSQDPQALPRIARRALEICHIDPETGSDIEDENTCVAACYECLLDYGNQRDHEILDRRTIRDVLFQLANATVEPKGRPTTRGDLFQQLWDNCDSNLERQWLKTIEEHGFVPPTHGQYLIESCHTRPDFFYKDKSVVIYVDGPPHDDPDVAANDKEIESRLFAKGYTSIRFHHTADWVEIMKSHTDIFGPGRTDS